MPGTSLLEQAAAPALPIVLAGIGPAILMHEALRRLGEGRAGREATLPSVLRDGILCREQDTNI